MTKKKIRMASMTSNKIISCVLALDINFLLLKKKIEG